MIALRLLITSFFLFTVSASFLRTKDSALKGHRQVQGKRKNNVCPTSQPVHGSVCRRSSRAAACDYDFINVPTLASKDDGSPDNSGATCTGEYTCQAVTHCSCVKRQWDCEITEVSSCKGNVPKEAFESCQGDRDEDEDEDETLFVPKPFVCPVTAPSPGTTCNIPYFTMEACPYDFSNIPVYGDNGYCVPDALACVPLKNCECMQGEWMCHESTLARCRDNYEPAGLLTSCTPL